MKLLLRRLLWSATVVGWAVATPASAQPRHEEVLKQLRARGWHDTVLLYLEEIEQDSNLPVTLREVLAYEKARSLLDSASEMRDLEKRQEVLTQARRNLETFLAERPGHPLAAEANQQFGKLLVERGRVNVLKAEQPVHRDQRSALQAEARRHFADARALFEKSHAQYEAAFKAFPTSIPKKNPQYEARQQVLEKRLQAVIDLAVARYETAQSYQPPDPQRNDALKQAADEFERIHNEHRTLGAGLYARLYQGKCFEEMNDIRKARGIYDELLGHDPFDPNQTQEQQQFLLRLQHQAKYFRLICLNHPQSKDYQLVVDEAEQWLRVNGARRSSEVGLGIQWELARALETLGQQTTEGRGTQKQLFRRAHDAAEQVARTPGRHRDAALATISRLRGKEESLKLEPENFADARDLAEAARSRAEQLEQEAKQAGDAEAAARPRAEETAQWLEAARCCRKALQLADAQTKIDDLNNVRIQLSYVYYKLGRSYDSAILAEQVAQRFPDASLARHAAFIALAAYLQAYNDARADAAFEIEQMIRSAEYLAQHWPQSGDADQARMILGGLYAQRGEPEAAVRWLMAVPENSEQFLEARQKAGMAYWNTYLNVANRSETSRPPQAELDQLAQQAQQILAASSTLARSRLAAGQPPPYTLLTCELCLAQIAVANNDYNLVGSLMIRGNGTGLLEMVQSGKLDAAPEGAPKRFAAEVYKVALSSHLGRGNLDAAKQMLQDLERLGDDAGSMADIYRALGEELQAQIQQVQARGDLRQLESLIATFDAFLAKIAQQDQQQPLGFYMLRWLGDANYGIGDALAGQRARGYFERAAAIVETIFKRAEQDAQFIPESTPGASEVRDALALRLATYKRRLGTAPACAEAYQLMKPLLEKSVDQPSRSLPLQIEAAYVHQVWAQYDAPKWQEAIAGVEKRKNPSAQPVPFIWGWAGIAKRLQQSPSARKGGVHYATYYEVVHNLAFCRYHQAREEKNPAKRKQLLARAERDILLSCQLSRDLGGPKWWPRFDQLLRQIQADLNKQATGLPQPPPATQSQAPAAGRRK